MSTPLRVGFLLSGLLHVAMVAAFSLSREQDIPAVDEPRPLTLNLALFQPAQAEPVPSPPLPASEPQAEPEPEVAVEPPPPESEPEPLAPVEPPPPPVVKKLEPDPPKLKSQPVVKRVSKPKPVIKPRARAKPVKKPVRETRSVETNPVPGSPVTLAAVTEPQVVAPAAESQQRQHYLAALAAKIDRSKYYPLGSRRRGEEGRVVVRFIVRKNGDLTDLAVVESSGSRRLDAAALKTVRRVTPFQPIPDTINRDQWPISVPIAFSLSG